MIGYSVVGRTGDPPMQDMAASSLPSNQYPITNIRLSSDRTLLLLGTLAVALYAAIVLLFPIYPHALADVTYDLEKLARGRRWAAYVYVGALAAQFVILALAARVAPRVRRPLPIVVGVGALAGLVLVGLYPVTAIDVFAYVVRGRMAALYGANTLAIAPDQFPGEPLLSFLGEWSTFTSPYGPFWELIGAGVAGSGARGALSGALAFKLLAWVAYLGATLALIPAVRGNAAALLLWAWNPLILLQGPGNGHNDLLMLFFLVVAAAAWLRWQNWMVAALAAALAVLVKATAVIFVPLLVIDALRAQPTWGRRLGVLAAMGALGGGLALLVYLPFWPPWESLGGLPAHMAVQRTYTPAALARMAAVALGAPGSLAADAVRTAGLAIFALTYAWLAWRLATGRTTLAAAAFWAYFAYLLAAPGFRIWYAAWPLPFAALAHAEGAGTLSARRAWWRGYLLAATAEFSILMFYLVWRWLLNGQFGPRADWLTMHLLTIPWQFGLPLLGPLLLKRSD